MCPPRKNARPSSARSQAPIRRSARYKIRERRRRHAERGLGAWCERVVGADLCIDEIMREDICAATRRLARAEAFDHSRCGRVEAEDRFDVREAPLRRGVPYILNTWRIVCGQAPDEIHAADLGGVGVADVGEIEGKIACIGIDIGSLDKGPEIAVDLAGIEQARLLCRIDIIIGLEAAIG